MTVSRVFLVLLLVGCSGYFSSAGASGNCTCIRPHDLGAVQSCQESQSACYSMCRDNYGAGNDACVKFDIPSGIPSSCGFSVGVKYNENNCTITPPNPNNACYISSDKVAVKLYEHTDFNGAERSFAPGYQWSDLGSLSYCTQNKTIGGTVSSIRVPTGHTVELYSGVNFSGQCLKIIGSDIIQNLDTTHLVYNDQPRSMIVYQQPGGQEPAGAPLSQCPTKR